MFRLFLLAAILFLNGCSSTPLDADAKKAFESKIALEIQGAEFNIAEFIKSNGQELEVSGAKAYRYFFNAKVIYPKGVHPECVQKSGRFAGFDCIFQFGSGRGIGPLPERAVVEYAGEVGCQKLERGWQCSEVTIRQLSMNILPLTEEEKAANQKKLEEETARQDQNIRKQAANAILACEKVVDEKKFKLVSSSAPIEPMRNSAKVQADGSIIWNGIKIDKDTFRQYLDAAGALSPAPFLVLTSDVGASQKQISDAQVIIWRSGLCPG